MRHVCSAYTSPGSVPILPYGKFSTNNIGEVAKVFGLSDYNSVPRRQRGHILIARALKIYGFEDSSAARNYGQPLRANKAVTISVMREQTCGIFGIAMSTGTGTCSHEEFPKKRKQMSKKRLRSEESGQRLNRVGLPCRP